MTSIHRTGANGLRPNDPALLSNHLHRQVTPPTGPEALDSSAPRRGRAFRSLVLGFADEESGDQIVIDVRGSGSFPRAAFLAGIERSGFTVLAEDGPGPEGVTSREAAG
ncbi:MAG: hypothetical protein NTV21_06775 [Planctomycetota bacterium]|nr:hypothetical protein [Planctomycetota bacterium]